MKIITIKIKHINTQAYIYIYIERGSEIQRQVPQGERVVWKLHIFNSPTTENKSHLFVKCRLHFLLPINCFYFAYIVLYDPTKWSSTSFKCILCASDYACTCVAESVHLFFAMVPYIFILFFS
ncbi:hypothetical protein, unlikely [Trypanosoma brucei brucei TREU927]|uniref:Uncharacterized protein n=1 Tax=Trypanosoma brucei brucei (strain 927/4 GUTat10.1) TaxID=185431 RepID=Q38FA8_TRYB2|nr:hypothetical protein, unlikely [Trypanosoma brucei brucei TREU927]EAN76512.1 hypothetical protein, unlikely [Trypanosoma brucei brucei TREU927]